MRISDWSSDVCSSDLVGNRQPARCAAQEDRLGKRAMHRDMETRNAGGIGCAIHQTSAPPPNEKNDRKKELAAKAIDRPNTIWISRRNPPDVSPNARVRTVAMMMITAMILATGPWIDSSIDRSEKQTYEPQ